MQSKVQSWVEVLVGTGVGFCTAMLTQAIVFPLFGVVINHATNFYLTLIFTVVSIVRSYFVRRVFNYLNSRKAAVA